MTTTDNRVGESLLLNYEEIASLFTKALDHFDASSACLEIGAYRGGASSEFLRRRDLKKLSTPYFIVDPYIPGGLSAFDPPEETMNAMLEKVRPYGNWQFFRKTSDDFFRLDVKEQIRNKGLRLNFALLDGDHTPEGEIRDIQNTIPFLGEKFFVVVDDIHCGPEYPEGLDRMIEFICAAFPGASIRFVPTLVGQQAWISKGMELW